MKNKIKFMVIALGIALFAGLIYWALQEGGRQSRPEAPEGETANMSYIGNTISEEKDGKKVWELTAEFIEIDPKSKNTVLKNITGVFYQENGDTVTLTAPKAVYEVESRNITITERVKAVTEKGATLDADKVVWDSRNEKFSGEGSIRVTQGDTVLTGDKMESNNGFTKIKMMGNAHIVKGGK